LKISQIILIVKYDATSILKIAKNFIAKNIIHFFVFLKMPIVSYLMINIICDIFNLALILRLV